MEGGGLGWEGRRFMRKRWDTVSVRFGALSAAYVQVSSRLSGDG